MSEETPPEPAPETLVPAPREPVEDRERAVERERLRRIQRLSQGRR